MIGKFWVPPSLGLLPAQGQPLDIRPPPPSPGVMRLPNGAAAWSGKLEEGGLHQSPGPHMWVLADSQCPCRETPMTSAGSSPRQRFPLPHHPSSLRLTSCCCTLISFLGMFLVTVGELRNLLIIHKTKTYETRKKAHRISNKG